MRKRALSLFLAMLMALSAAVPAMAAEDTFTAPMEEAVEAAAPVAPEALPEEPAPETAPDPVPAETEQTEQAEEPMPVDVPAPVEAEDEPAPVDEPAPGLITDLKVSVWYRGAPYFDDPDKDFYVAKPVLRVISKELKDLRDLKNKKCVLTFPNNTTVIELSAPNLDSYNAGTGNYSYLWQIPEENKAEMSEGLYTLSVYEVGGTEKKHLAIGQGTLYKVKFNAGEGSYDDPPTEPKGSNSTCVVQYAPEDGLLASTSIFDFKRPTKDGEDFLGWERAVPLESGKLADYVSELKFIGNYTYETTAVYGEEAHHTYKLTFPGQEEDLLNKGEKNPVSIGDDHPYGNTNKVEFTLVNTGNRDLTGLSVLSASSRLEVDKSAMVGTLPVHGKWTIGITPKNDLPVGHYSEKVTFSYGRGFQTVWFEFEIIPQEVSLTVVEPTKKYGQVLSASEVEVKASNGKTLAEMGYWLDSVGFSSGASVGTHPISLMGSSANYNVSLAGAPQVTVEQAAVVTGSIHALTIRPGDKLPPLEGTFYTKGHPNEEGWEVTGDLAWVEPSKTLNTSEECDWVFTPKDGNHTELRGQYQVIVSPLEPTEISLTSQDSFVYNRQPYGLSFTTDRAGENRQITVKYRKQGSLEDWSEVKPMAAGIYDVTAHVDNDDLYAEDDWEGTMTITQKTLTANIGNDRITAVRYGDSAEIVINGLTPIGLCSGDQVDIAATGTIIQWKVGETENVGFKLSLTGPDAGNYTTPASSAVKSVPILPRLIKKLTVTGADNLEKDYGYTMTLSGVEAVPTDIVPGDNVEFTFSSLGTAVTADVKDYDVYVTVNDNRYAFPGDVRTMTVPNVKLVVKAVKPTVTVTAGNGKKGGLLSAVNLIGSFHHPENPDMPATGTLEWDDTMVTLPDTDTCTAEWKFSPDGPNYAGEVRGKAVITLVDRDVLPVTVKPQTVKYNGEQQKYDTTVNLECTVGHMPPEIKYRPEAELAKGVATVSLMPAAAGPDDGSSLDWSTTAPKKAGVYTVCVQVRPNAENIYEYAEEHVHTTMTIQKAEPDKTNTGTIPNIPLGTLLENITPPLPKGVDGQPLPGTYLWTQPGDTPVTQDGVSYKWIFSPVDDNYNTLEGSTTINLLKETRLAKAQVFNLPGAEGDYARLDLEASALTAGDVVTFYSDSACTDPVSEAHTVAGSSGTEVVLLEAGALAQTAGTIYARISGFEAKPSPAGYPAEPGFTVKTSGSTSLKAYTEGTVPVTVEAGPGYTAETAKFAGDANLKVTEDSGLGAKLQGDVYVTSQTEALLTVEVTVNHPDQVGHPGETITLTKTVTVTVIPGPVPKPPSGGGGGGIAPSPSPSPSTSPSPSPSPTPGPGGGEEPPPAPVDPPKTNNGTGWSYDYDTGEWYFFKKEELVANYWVGKIDGASQWDKNWYYVGPDGRMLTGMQYIDDLHGGYGWYYLQPTNDHGEIGKMLTGWQWVGGDYGECYFSKKNGEAGKCTWSEKLGDCDPATGQWTGG